MEALIEALAVQGGVLGSNACSSQRKRRTERVAAADGAVARMATGSLSSPVAWL